MTEPSFDILMQRHEMGQAYIAITQSMGPSAQLAAFVDYQNVQGDKCGLESFNIMDLHEQILKDIDADPSFDMAMEQISHGLSEMIEGEHGSIGTEGFAGKLFRKFFSGLPTYTSFSNSKAYVKMLHDWTVLHIRAMPSTLKLSEWEKYDAKMDKELAALNTQINTLMGKKITGWEIDSNVSFAKSGWTKDKYEAELRWLDAVDKDSEQVLKNNKDKLEKVKALIEANSAKSDPDSAKVGKLVKNNIASIDGLAVDLGIVSNTCRPMLARVKKHLDDIKD